jgi:hypothetical protein
LSSQFRRLSDIVADVRYRFGTGGVTNRHPPERIKQLFNISWQHLREIVALTAEGAYLEATVPANLSTVAAVTGEVYSEQDWPVDAVAIMGVRVRATTSSRWYPLKRIPWAAYQDYQYANVLDGFRRQPGPIAYIARKIQDGVETTETPGKIMIMPIPTGGQYRLWYLPAWTPQVEEDDLFSGHAAWFEWALYDTLIKMLGPDADTKKNYGIWSLERDAARALIESRANRLVDGDALEPRDARGDGMDPERWGEPW